MLEYNRLARTYPQAVFLRIDADVQSEEASRFRIERVPTFIFFYCGEEKERYVGTDVYTLEATVQQYSQINQVPFPKSVPVASSEHDVRRAEMRRVESKDQASFSPQREFRRQGSPGSGSQPHRLGTKRSDRSPLAPPVASPAPPVTSPASSTTLPAPSPSPAPEPQPVDPSSSVRRTLTEMGFSPEVINSAFRLTEKRDIETLTEVATLVSENMPKSSSSEWEMAVMDRSGLHAQEQMLRLSKSHIVDKQREKVQDKSDRQVRANEAAKAQQRREEEQQHRKKVIEQFNCDHNFSTESPYLSLNRVT